MNLQSILTLRCELPVWKTQIQQHMAKQIDSEGSGSKARPHRISDWLIDL